LELHGRVWKFGSDIDTDTIIPGIYLYTTDADILGKHCMEVVVPGFAEKVHPGDILVAGDNFGCGSSREHAPMALKAIGLSCVIAKSFARIFFRNSINIGFRVLESEEAGDKIENRDELVVYPEEGKIVNLTRKEEYQAVRQPKFIDEIISKGGILSFIKSKHY